MPLPPLLQNVTLTLKANVYFDGGVVSHTLTSSEGRRQTVGLIRPGTYRFTTSAAEHMTIIAGTSRVKVGGEGAWTPYQADQSFQVPAHSFFEIAVDDGLVEYLCVFE